MARLSGVIGLTLADLEGVLTDAGLRNATFNQNVRDSRFQAYWSGGFDSESGQLIAYTVDVIGEDYHDIGDLFVTAWNAVADSEQFFPVGLDVLYNEIPLGHEHEASYATFTAVSNQRIDARGF